MSSFQLIVALCAGNLVSAQVATFCPVKQKVSQSNVTFTLYNQRMPNGDLINTTNLDQIDATQRTVFIIHGWLQTGTQGWILQMKDEYLRIGNANVIIADWSAYAFCIDYWSTAEAVPEVGTIVGDFIWTLASSKRIQLKNSQINGYSLGAHIGGIAGQKLQSNSGGSKIGRINGLDATRLGFEEVDVNRRLDAQDAEFVQAFHTSSNGFQARYGTVDVYFNVRNGACGELQPGCPFRPGVPAPANPLLPIVFCNHIRAAVYFVHSIGTPPETFQAVRCTCKKFSSKKCTGPTMFIGEHAPSSAQPGTYFLNTKCQQPYGLFTAGTLGGNTDYFCRSQ